MLEQGRDTASATVEGRHVPITVCSGDTRGHEAFGNAGSESAVGEKAHCYIYEVGVCQEEVALGNGSVEPVLTEAVTPGVPCDNTPSKGWELGIFCPRLIVPKSSWIKCGKEKSVLQSVH